MPISSKRIMISGAPSTGVGQTHSPGTYFLSLLSIHEEYSSFVQFNITVYYE